MSSLSPSTYHRRGALLLEVVLALALFVTAGIAILSMVGQSVGSLKSAREKLHAADLARSAMAKIEAGRSTITDPAFTTSGAVDKDRPCNRSCSAIASTASHSH